MQLQAKFAKNQHFGSQSHVQDCIYSIFGSQAANLKEYGLLPGSKWWLYPADPCLRRSSTAPGVVKLRYGLLWRIAAALRLNRVPRAGQMCLAGKTHGQAARAVWVWLGSNNLNLHLCQLNSQLNNLMPSGRAGAAANVWGRKEVPGATDECSSSTKIPHL